VFQPASRKSRGSVGTDAGIRAVYPGAEVGMSATKPMPTEWWLRPVSNAARVGEHIAVTWNLLYRNPFAASRSIVGVSMSDP
jgi:hypothetical protein